MTHVHEEQVQHSTRKMLPRPPPGFARTAIFFERLAKQEKRDSGRRQRLLDVAGFYRALARIIPGMPDGYKNSAAGLPLTRAQRWHARAEECRTLADCFTNPTCRRQLTQLAQDYDRMAEAAE